MALDSLPVGRCEVPGNLMQLVMRPKIREASALMQVLRITRNRPWFWSWRDRVTGCFIRIFIFRINITANHFFLFSRVVWRFALTLPLFRLSNATTQFAKERLYMNERPSQHMLDELADGAWQHSGVSLGPITLGNACSLMNVVKLRLGS